jgi:hypothetical protein
MAEIVYKEGCEGQNRLNAIEGIKIEFDGGETLIFPKYAKHVILNKNFDLEDWDSDEMTIEEAMESDGGAENEELYRINSPAEIFVCQFQTFKWGMRDLPNLAIAMEIVRQMREIDRQAEKIVGADLLRENRGGIWSCARASGDSCYIVLFEKRIFPDIVCDEHVCVPCVLNYTE